MAPQNLIFYVLLPLGLVMLNMLGNIGFVEMIAGETIDTTALATLLAAAFMVSFQFFSGEILIYSIYDDLKEGPVRWRLMASPVPQRTFLAGASMASWLFNLLQGILIFTVTALVFDIEWGNPLVLVAVLLIISIMSQLVAALISQLAPKRKNATVASMIFCFGQMLLSGFFFVPLGNSAIATFLQEHGTPLSLASRAILFAGPILDDMSEAMFNIGVLAAITAVLAVLVFALGRRRRA